MWRELCPVLDSERMYMALYDLCIFGEKYRVLPKLDDALDMFRMITPSSVRVVIVAQSPYPGRCPATGIPYACGPAFLPARGCTTTPVTLKNVVSEVHRDFGKKVATETPSSMLLRWIDQGVMLLNASLTLGADCPKYLEDHSVLWQEIVQDIVCTICDKLDPVVVLVGKEAWKLEGCIKHGTRVLRVSHPAARNETSTPWLGSRVFSAISYMMIQREEMPIRWL